MAMTIDKGHQKRRIEDFWPLYTKQGVRYIIHPTYKAICPGK